MIFTCQFIYLLLIPRTLNTNRKQRPHTTWPVILNKVQTQKNKAEKLTEMQYVAPTIYIF